MSGENHISISDSADHDAVLTRLPNEVLGNTSGPLSRAIQKGVIEGMSPDEVKLLWYLIAMESQGISFQPSYNKKQLSILSHRNHVYSLMKFTAVDDNSAVLDGFVFSVAVAATIEKRIGNAEHANYHIRGLKKLVDMRGGLRAIRNMQYPKDLMLLSTFVELGLPELYTYKELLYKLPHLRLKLQDLQTWNCDMISKSTHKEARTSSNEQHLADRRSLMSNSRTYQLSTFNKAALKEYITLPTGRLTDSQYRFYLAVLYAINNALWTFRENHKASIIYLVTLADAARMSTSSGFILQCFGDRLPSLLMLLMIAHHAADYGGRENAAEAASADEEVFEFVELMMLARPMSRDAVLEALWSWLRSPNVIEFTNLSHSKLDFILEEIEGKWLEMERSRDG